MDFLDLSKILKTSEGELNHLLDKTRETSWHFFGKRIYFYAPTFLHYVSDYNHKKQLFPSISVTGNKCSLRCGHCNGKMLETMMSARSPRRLIELCKKIEKMGAVGCLISGGCLPDGSVPLEPFIDAMAEIKRNTKLNLMVHTGIINEETAIKLANAKVDLAMIDIIGSDETINELYKLNVTVPDYENSIGVLRNAGVRIVPHVLVGLHYGKIKGEINALKIISKYNPSAVIFIIFIPIKGTTLEKVSPPNPIDVSKVIVAARMLMPKIPQALGCARPVSDYRKLIDALAIHAGVNAIAFPSDDGISIAKSLGLEIKFSSFCCSQVYADINIL